MSPTYPAFARSSPFRPPDWRWLRAYALLDTYHNFSRKRDDAETGRALRYLRLLCRRPRSAARLFPDVQAAHAVYDEGGPTRLLLEAQLLARQTSSAIGELMNLPAEVVDSYESFFFQCREHLAAHDWVLSQAVDRPTPGFANQVRGITLRAFAFHGGPRVLAAVSPYLLTNRDLFDPPLDLSTPAGRQEQGVRLAIATQMLPRTSGRAEPLKKIMLLLHEIDRNRPFQADPTSLLVRNIGIWLSGWPGDVSAGLMEVSEKGSMPSPNPVVTLAG